MKKKKNFNRHSSFFSLKVEFYLPLKKKKKKGFNFSIKVNRWRKNMLSVWYEDNTVTAHASHDKNIS